jgi:hypothetical protein
MQGLLVTVSGQNNNIPNVPFMIKEVLSVRYISWDFTWSSGTSIARKGELDVLVNKAKERYSTILWYNISTEILTL